MFPHRAIRSSIRDTNAEGPLPEQESDVQVTHVSSSQHKSKRSRGDVWWDAATSQAGQPSPEPEAPASAQQPGATAAPTVTPGPAEASAAWWQHRSRRSSAHVWPDAAASLLGSRFTPPEPQEEVTAAPLVATVTPALTPPSREAVGAQWQHRSRRSSSNVWPDAAAVASQGRLPTKAYKAPASAKPGATAATAVGPLVAEVMGARSQHRSKRTLAEAWPDSDSVSLQSSLPTRERSAPARSAPASAEPSATLAAAPSPPLPAEVPAAPFALLELPPELLARVLCRAGPTAQRVCRAFRTAWCDGRTTLTIDAAAAANPAAAAAGVDDPQVEGLLARLPLLESLVARHVGKIPWAGCCPRLRQVEVHNSPSASLWRLMDVYGTREGHPWAIKHLLAEYKSLVEEVLQQQQQPLPPEQRQQLDELAEVMRPLQAAAAAAAAAAGAAASQPLQGAAAARPLSSSERQKAVNLADQLEPLPSCLTSLSLRCCNNLRNLGAIVLFRSLQTLVLHDCAALVHLEPLGQCAELTSLQLSYCVEVSGLDALAHCAHLTSLRLEYCDSLTSVAPLAECRHLADLSLHSCLGVTDGVDAVAAMTQLTALDVFQQPDFCTLLRERPLASRQLAMLRVDCSELRDLRSLVPPSLSSLRRLDLSGCSNLASVDDLSTCVSLTSVNLQRCSALRDVGAALSGSRRSLTSLDLSECASVVDTSFAALLSGCSTLKVLQLQRCKQHLVEVGVLAACVELRTLDLSCCPQLASVALLSALVRLEALDLHGCHMLADVAALAGCTALTDLNLTHCGAVGDITPLHACTALTTLSLVSCRSVASVAPLAACTRLVKLSLSNCPLLRDVCALSHCRRLTSLTLNSCPLVADAAPLASCTTLITLVLAGCRIPNVTALAACRTLNWVNLSSCRRLTSLASLQSSAATLTSLHLHGCVGLRSLRPLASCSQLTLLDLDGCAGIRSLQPLCGCAATLKTLMLRGVPDCHDMRALTALTACHVRRGALDPWLV